MQNRIKFGCKFLKTDEAHVPQPDVEAMARTNMIYGPFICIKTMQPFGPDQNPADPDVCKRSRSCFENSVRT